MEGKRKGQPGYGQGLVNIEGAEELFIDGAELAKHLLDTFKSPSYKPPTLPDAALKVVEVSRNPNASANDLVKLLEDDQMLASRVLKIAQSPIHGGAQLKSLRDAVVRMGMKNVRDIVLEAAMNMRMFKAPGYKEALENLRKHSSATAHVAKLICRYCSIEGDYAFLCGLLHDIGISGVLLSLGDVPKGQKRPDLQNVWPAVVEVHEEAAGILAKLWALPMEIQMIVENHHKLEIQGYAHPLLGVILVAENMVDEAGFKEIPPKVTHVEDTRGKEERLKKAKELIGLNEKTEALVKEGAEDIFSSL